MDTTKNNGIVLATLIITMIVLSIILSITFAITLKNPSLHQLLPGIRKRNIEKIYQEQLDARIQQEKFTGNEETDNNKVHQIITEIVQQEHTIVGEIPKYTTGFEHDYTFTIQEKNKNVKTEITLKSKAEFNNALQQVSMDSGYTKTIPLPEVGDTVIYDPTKGVTDQSKLTYTSYKGTAKTGGNGYGTQTVTAKAEINEWVVISTANNQVKLMPKKKETQIFKLKGAIGWLYAEEELHKASSIYGYGKGADQSKTFTYQVGNYQIPEEVKTKTLTGSGARNMTMEDIVKIIKGEEYSDFTDEEKKSLDNHSLQNMTPHSYYSLNSEGDDGIVNSSRTFKSEFMGIGEIEYDVDFAKNILVNNNKRKLRKYIFDPNYKNHTDVFWLATRCVIMDYGFKNYQIVFGRWWSPMFHYSDWMQAIMGLDYYDENIKRYLIPIVFLKQDIALEKINVQNDGSVTWKIKE
ncbi:MAG: hypothetical protein ACTTGJ_01450 [Clostridium sp.]